MFILSVRMNNSEYLDEPVLAQMDNFSFGRNIDLRDRAVIGVIRIYQPVGFEASAPMPFQRANQFQVVDTRIP